MIQYMPREADNKYYNSNLMKAPDFSRNSINIENAHPNGCALASEKSPHIFGQLFHIVHAGQHHLDFRNGLQKTETPLV